MSHETPRTTHRRAMNLALQAHLDSSPDLFRQAYELEKQACDFYTYRHDAEPTRSILYRSAAALAMKAGLYDEARQMIERGKTANAPAEIVAEMDEIFSRNEQKA